MTNPTLIFMAGSPGAGKGYTIAKHYGDWTVVDCDAWKARHPDYDPKNPGVVHEWSSNMAEAEFYSRMERRESFIMDGTLTNVEKSVVKINEAKALGYNVVICFVKVALATALQRNANRERVVPESIVCEKFALIGTCVDILSRYADEVRTIEND